MATTFVKIATVTAGAGGSSFFEFTSIPSTYTDLILLTSLRASQADIIDHIRLQFNGDTTSGNYTGRRVFGSGSGTPPSDTGNYLIFTDANTATASTFSNTQIYIPNYLSAVAKSFSADSVTESNGATTALAGLMAQLWSGTSAITSIKLTPNVSGTWLQYSTATLYGISKS